MAGGKTSKRERPGKTAGAKTQGAKKQTVKSANARRREQAKRMQEADTTQQGNRANIRQNTTPQGHSRPK